MSVVSAQKQESVTAIEMGQRISHAQDEFMALCPGCKAFETLWFTGDKLVPTRKFSQEDGHIYHRCGSSQPCRLYRRC